MISLVATCCLGGEKASLELSTFRPLLSAPCEISAGPDKQSQTLAATTPGAFGIAQPVSVCGRVLREISVSLYVPADAPVDLKVACVLKDKDGLWFDALWPTRPKRGEWQTITFPVEPGSAEISPRGHEAVWNDYYAQHITAVGIQFFSARQWQGSVLIGKYETTFADKKPALRIRNLHCRTAQPMSFTQCEWAFDVDSPAKNVFTETEITVEGSFTCPSGNNVRVPAFYYQPYRRELGSDGIENITPTGRAGWRLRFSPIESGPHRLSLLVQCRGASLETGALSFDVAPGKPRGFVRVSERDSRFFETADGAFFYPIGQNIHAPFDKRCAEMLRVPVLPNRGTFAYDSYFEKMARAGENAVVMWMSNWWLSIEWSRAWKGFNGLSDYNLGNAWRLDYLLDAAARHGIYVHLVLDNHGKLSKFVDPEWDANPFNLANGGPCRSPEEFFAHHSAFEPYKQRLRYIVARWSSHPNLLGYELMGEINLVGSDRSFKDDPAQAAWCRRVKAYLREVDPYQRLVSIHYSNDYLSVDPKVASLREIDYLVGDSYKAGGSIVPLILKTAQENGRFGKPTFSTEFGGNWNGTTPARLHADLHAGLWSNCMTNSAAAPFFWWFDYIDRYDLYRELSAISKYMQGDDRRGTKLETAVMQVMKDGRPDKDVSAIVLVGATRAYFWVYDVLASEVMPEPRFARAHSDISFTIPGTAGVPPAPHSPITTHHSPEAGATPALQPGRYTVEFWNTSKGEVLQRTEVTADTDGLRLQLPAFKIDIAGKVFRTEADK